MSFALTKRRNIHEHHIQPVKEIVSECALFDLCFEVLVRSTDDPDIRMDILVAAETLKFPLLEKSQELDLHGRGEFSHFVEEKGPSVRFFKPPDPPLRGTGEGTLFMSEEFNSRAGFREERRN